MSVVTLVNPSKSRIPKYAQLIVSISARHVTCLNQSYKIEQTFGKMVDYNLTIMD